MSEELLTGNVGDWSELYVFFHLLGSPYLMSCDRALHPIGTIVPVKAIYRGNDKEGNLLYTYNEVESNWDISCNAIHICKVTQNTGKEEAKSLLKEMLTKGNGSMSSPKAEKFLRLLCDHKMKSLGKKEDITLKINDVKAGQETITPFSIKSYIGSDPSLLNANKDGTNFLYEVTGINDKIYDLIQAEVEKHPRTCIVTLIKQLKRYKAEVIFRQLLNQTFEDNLQIIGLDAPEFLAHLLLSHYMTGEHSVLENTKLVAEKNPFNLRKPTAYYNRAKKILQAAAFGMTPSKEWDGLQIASGGFIIVKPNGEVVTYQRYDMDLIDNYLIEYTYFDHPSTSRHKYGKLFKDDDGRFYLKLAIQIRFRKP